MNNSQYHAIAKWLAEILRSVKNQLNRYTTADSFDFVDSILRQRNRKENDLTRCFLSFYKYTFNGNNLLTVIIY